MKALVVPSSTAKEISNIKLIDMDKPVINNDEVMIRVHALGLNPVDYKLVKGHNTAWNYPHIIGLDAAGEVVTVGSNNPKKFQIGERVFFHSDLSKNGVFAEFAKSKYNVVARIPNNVKYEEATAVLCSGLTAYQAIFRKMSLAGKKTILIHAGAGGVGTIAIQLAKIAGLTVITTVSEYKKNIVKTLGADHIIDYRHENIDNRINEITDGNGVDLIINDIGNPEADLPRLAYNGGLICILNTPNIANYDLSSNGQSIMSLNLGGVHQSGYSYQLDDLATMAESLVKLIFNKQLDPVITKVINFEDIPAGLNELSEHKTVGKIVATI
ncbi:zinc-binding dehydrogenase [Companilactobacillus nodensis]|uniref:Alcohol dehydrogenase n=1 Tax=Companilactobacillus nodensis DSM 19682 = JCM 14932 = NBRC 107160 TaxID=1423775 RepID=A0A0R1KDY1_9LACO|nr:zinc-binding dehydrogenase [Companilactobacillus nodensis]KRK79731.1 alcohol dehydrogenase [Companilactobacillus nodensis DSM 19682 = JCM 14932 = NBRC 107160]